MSNYWQNKICLVTGASSGLGLAIAKSLATQGATVALNARTESRLLEAVDLLVATGGKAIALPGDVTDPSDVEALASEVQGRFAALDLLCNCAGRSTRGKALDTTAEQFQELWEVNFLSVVRLSRAFAPKLIERRGHLVNIGSLAGKLAPRYLGAYPASKFALSAYSQQLRLELEPQGLHVLLVCPGPIKRDDAGQRYADPSTVIPDAAQNPGAGAKLRGIEPDWLAERILAACEKKQLELVLPGKVRLLMALSQLSPKLGDWILKKSTSG